MNTITNEMRENFINQILEDISIRNIECIDDTGIFKKYRVGVATVRENEDFSIYLDICIDSLKVKLIRKSDSFTRTIPRLQPVNLLTKDDFYIKWYNKVDHVFMATIDELEQGVVEYFT